jgi:hypothetical protein
VFSGFFFKVFFAKYTKLFYYSTAGLILENNQKFNHFFFKYFYYVSSLPLKFFFLGIFLFFSNIFLFKHIINKSLYLVKFFLYENFFLRILKQFLFINYFYCLLVQFFFYLCGFIYLFEKALILKIIYSVKDFIFKNSFLIAKFSQTHNYFTNFVIVITILLFVLFLLFFNVL